VIHTVSEPDSHTWPDASDEPSPPPAGWMQSFCDTAETYQPGREWTRYVQRIEIAGRTWSYATDRRSAVYVADYGAEVGECVKAFSNRYLPVVGDHYRQVMDYLLKPLHFDFECDLHDLLAFVGPFKLDECIRCKDERHAGNSVGCEECDFTGTLWPVKPDVRIRWPGRWFDPLRISQALTPLAGIGVKRLRCGFLMNSLKPDEQPFAAEAVATDGRTPWFRVIVMGMLKQTLHHGAIVRERMDIGFPRYIPGVGALWHLRFGFDAPLRDWIEEQGEDPDDILGMPF